MTFQTAGQSFGLRNPATPSNGAASIARLSERIFEWFLQRTTTSAVVALKGSAAATIHHRISLEPVV